MRLLKVKIEIYRGENSSITGEEDIKSKLSDAVIDLDAIESLWVDWGGKLRVSMASHDCFGVMSHTFDQMFGLWKGDFMPEVDLNKMTMFTKN